MRQQWVPLSYGDGSKSQSSSGNSDNKDDSFPNKPKDILKIGFKDSFYIETEWKGSKNTAVRKLGCVGYRSGTGTSVSIALSSRFRKAHWDFTTENPADMAWYHDKNLSWFD